MANTITPNVGLGVQPQDNPNPQAGTEDSSASNILSQSLPQPAPTPAPGASSPNPLASPQPAPEQASLPPGGVSRETDSSVAPQPSSQTAKEDKDVDALFDQLKAPKSEEQKKQEIDDIFNQVDSDTNPNAPIVDPRKPGESWLNYQMRNLPETAKFIGAQMRANLGINPTQHLQAFQSMYGDENVKAVGGALYFRPDKDSKFRKVDQTLWNPIADFMTQHALEAIPLAANVLTQGGIDAASALGAPETGGVSLGGMALAGGAGGAVESATKQSLQGVINLFSAKPQTATLGEAATDLATSTATNAVLGPVGHSIFGVARQGISKVGSLLASAAGDTVVPAAEKAAGALTTKLAMARQAFKEFVSVVYPAADETSPKEFASSLKDIFQKADERLGGAVDAVKAEVTSLSNQSGSKAPVDNSLKAINDILSEHGYAVDHEGQMSLANNEALNLVKPDVKTALEALKNHYNSISDQAFSQGGISAEDLFQHAENLQNLSRFDKGASISDDATALYRKAWKATTADRNAFIDQTLKSADSPSANNWASEFAKYHDQIDAVRTFKDMLSDTGSRENFFQSLMTGNKIDRTNLFDAAKTILGPDSKEWSGLQGQFINHMLNDATTNGVLNSTKVLKFMTSDANKEFVSRLMAPQDQVVFKKMLLQSQQIEKAAKISDTQQKGLIEGVKKLFQLSSDAAQGAYNAFLGLGGSKVQLNYLLDDGFNKMIKEAEGPAMRNRIMEGRRLIEGLTSKMKIVNAPSQLENTVKSVQRYAPAISAPAARGLVNSLSNGQVPDTGNSTPTENP